MCTLHTQPLDNGHRWPLLTLRFSLYSYLFFLLHALLFTHFESTQEADFYINQERFSFTKDSLGHSSVQCTGLIHWGYSILQGLKILWHTKIELSGWPKVGEKQCMEKKTEIQAKVCVNTCKHLHGWRMQTDCAKFHK